MMNKIKRIGRIKFIIRLIIQIFIIATIVYAFRTKQSHGRFCGVPFEFRIPTVKRAKKRWWNPDDPRIFTEHVFGIGWSINLCQVVTRLRCSVNKQQA